MARRPHGIVYGLLGVSLALNLVGAGYLGFAGWRKPNRTVESTIDFVTARYPSSVRQAVRDTLEDRRADLRTALQELRDARRGARDALSAPDIDRAKVDAAFAQSREKAAAFQSVIHAAIAEAVAKLPAAERAKIDGGGGD